MKERNNRRQATRTARATYLHLLSCLCCVCWLLTSCSTTKNIPDDDQLFIGLTQIDYQKHDNSQHFLNTQEEIEAALATQPNGALFGSSYYRTPFPYGLWIWNYAYGSSGKIKKWLNRSFGKPPVLMSQVNPQLRASVAQSVLHKNGYMHGKVTYEEVPQKNPKKMKIGYTVTMDTLFTVDSMAYVNFPPAMQALIDSTIANARVGKDKPFAASTLDAERSRISQLFRNNGYYYYQPNYATYLADTFAVENRAQLRLQLADSLPQEVLRPWYMGNIKMQLRHTAREAMTDSIDRRILKIYYGGGKKHAPIRPRVILKNLKLRPHRLFSYDDYIESMQKINATGVFSNVDLSFTPRDNDTLDLTLNCTFDKPYDLYVEGNFINRTIGRMGPGVKLGVVRRNAFHGGEKLDVNLHGSYEWQTNSNMSGMNTYQYGADAAIEFPRIVAPFVRNGGRRTKDGKRIRPRQFYATPWTIAKVSTDIVNRPQYYKMHIVSGEWTYRWQPSAISSHEFSPLTLKYQYMNSSTALLAEVLERTPYLAVSMADYFIPKMRYTYAYNSPHGTLNPIRWETSIEESGNITALYDVVVQGNGWKQKNKTLFKNPYSQFVKLETDLTKTWTLDGKSQLVGHVNAGVMWCYGNSTDAPFSELFYAGGANSIRAFPVRSIGPGGFVPYAGPNNRLFSYALQNGDSKLVMNLEYRRNLFGSLNGALFLDMGNVWYSRNYSIMESIYDENNNVVGQNEIVYDQNKFKVSRLLDQMALGTGIGLRYDLDFLVVRVDWGLGLHLPYDTGKSGYFNIPRFKDMHTLHLAIGYPF